MIVFLVIYDLQLYSNKQLCSNDRIDAYCISDTELLSRDQKDRGNDFSCESSPQTFTKE